MMWTILPPLLLAVVHYLLAVRHYGVLTPDGLFVCTQLLMVIGTAALVDPESPVDVAYLRLIVAAVMIYMVVSCVTYLALRARPDQPTEQRVDRRSYLVRMVPPDRRIVLGAGIALAVIVVYFAAVGYSAFLVGLRGQLSGNPQNIAALRLESYAGNTYLFPGYANQFKNVLYPALVVVILTWVFIASGPFARLFGMALLGSAIFGLLGNGQRGAFFLFLITLLVYIFVVNRRRITRWVVLLPVLGLPFALLATYALGRSAGVGGNPIRVTALELYSRFLNDNQLSGLAAYRYTESLPVQYGREWLQGVRGILPGDRGSTLANEVFATMYGSTAGTSPPSLWGSVHYNFGTVGVVVFAALLGVGLQHLTFHTLRRPVYNTLELIAYSGVTATVGTWAVAGPDALMNLGIVAYLALWWWGARWNRLQRPVAAMPEAGARRAVAHSEPWLAGPAGPTAPIGAPEWRRVGPGAAERAVAKARS